MVNLKQHVNVPNILSAYRLVSFPFVLFFALWNFENVFAVLLVINLITDALDGIIARAFKLETEFGAVLDAYADIGMYITAILGVIIFKSADMAPHFTSLAVFIVVFIIPKIISFYKFKKFPSLHLYSSKIGGYMQGIFFFSLFTFGFNSIFYYIMITWGIISFVEQIVVVSIADEPRSNVKGLYWFLTQSR